MIEVQHESAKSFVPDPIFPCPPTDAGPSAMYLRALVENSPIAIVVLNARHQYVMCNPAFERLFQYTPKQLSSADLDDLIAGPEMAEEAAQLTRSVMQGQIVHMVAHRRRRDGMMVDVEIHGIPLTLNGATRRRICALPGCDRAQRGANRIPPDIQSAGKCAAGRTPRLARDLHDSRRRNLRCSIGI